ncbi:SEFIR domain-containing protein [Brevibacillus sp. NPDC003359]|uniref:SEFIR domain-containing protein n=1 Tax=unclassified Brevibacillus TaxID=2684853 RepID=UPI0036CFC526
MESAEKIPKVFISYCWSSEKHIKWVLSLAEKLVAESGVDVILDQWHGEIGHDRFHFMEESIREADRVLVICDKTYCYKANDRTGGVGTETRIITPEVYRSNKQDKFIPVALELNEHNEYLLPDFMNSRFALGMIKEEEFEPNYKQLERLIWQVPLLKPPVRGKKPDFESESETAITPIKTRPLLNKFDEERVIWLLPRGFLHYTDISYQSNNSWAVVVYYYNYDGECIHGTHYHDSYSRRWDNNIETQYSKLSIPEADWQWCRAPLNFLQELREVSEPTDIHKMVTDEQEYDYPVYYFKPGEPIYLPEVPQQYRFYYDTGNLRDILVEMRDKKDMSRLPEEELFNRAMTLRQSVALESLALLGVTHPSLSFINEVLNDFDKSFSSTDILMWFSRLDSIIQNTLNHEWDKWQKQLKAQKY